MIIKYQDDSYATVYLGDLYSSSDANSTCWIRLDDNVEWIRSPYNIIETRKLLRRVQSTSELDFDNALRLR